MKSLEKKNRNHLVSILEMGVYLYIYIYMYNIVIIVVNDHRSIIIRYIGRPIPGEKNSREETYVL